MKSPPNAAAGTDCRVALRVLSYNVRSMRDDTAALARVIGACAPDVVLVQEAPRFLRRRAKLVGLAAASGLEVLSGGVMGVALLRSPRVEVERVEDVRLPRTPGLHGRGFSTAVVRLGAARLGVLSCHLSLQREERYAQGGMLLERLADSGAEHLVAGGDLNEPPDGRTFRRLAAELRDCRVVAPRGGEHTFPARDPRRRIDAVLVSAGVTVDGCGVPSGLPGVGGGDLAAATDHLPVLADLRVPAGGA
ncbi:MULTISPECIES: endonuclease/exonuclease/phosphatase family protein [unclassified Streptomyces]|uniref:endonuclease/exonuclease/phosphatase family protein n=1 Tax=unclassified Streptomyces TaxID=2593676 RepID=UPI001907B6E8|nr:endonuclease/exonuclease/phosphatase family protein [Streptomyces sp. HSG2]